MALNVKCKNCNNYRNDWCEKVIDSPDPGIERDCRHFLEKTNADRIRNMSDEEMADFFREIYEAGMDDATSYEWGIRQYSFIWDDGWLKQPAE